MKYTKKKKRRNKYRIIMAHKFTLYTLIFVMLVPFASCRHSNRSERHGHSQQENRKTAEIPDASRETPARKRNNSAVKMRKEHGVYHVPCKINGTEMEFIFDTGASDITMSLTEAKFLYKQGKLKDTDFINTRQYQIADGSIHEGMVVNLRRVEIGDWLLKNVEASIVDNENAPLLLGQSALAAFGKISIDYKRNEITFE